MWYLLIAISLIVGRPHGPPTTGHRTIGLAYEDVNSCQAAEARLAVDDMFSAVNARYEAEGKGRHAFRIATRCVHESAGPEDCRGNVGPSTYCPGRIYRP